MDVQNGIVSRLGEQSGPFIRNVNLAIATARCHAMPVHFIRVAFRPGAPEASARNAIFSALASSFELDAEPTQIHPALERFDDDVVIVKKRVSAFAGSDLDVVLRAQGTTSLVLCGIATSGVVLSTVRHAADLDFTVTVLRDVCFDQDPEVQSVLMEKVFARQATVVTVDEWTTSLGESPSTE
jgi:nicotinamidase-related amidase